MSETESVAAAKRIRASLNRAHSLGNPSLIVSAADLEAVIQSIANGSGLGPGVAERIREANAELDAMIAADDVELDGVPTRANQAWSDFQVEGAAIAAMLSPEQRLLMRGGYIGGYIYGWGEAKGYTR